MVDQRIREMIAEQLRRPKEEIRDDLHIATDLGADSLDQTEMLLAFEHEFGLKLEPPEAGFGTVLQVIQRIARAVEEKNARGTEASDTRV